MLRYACLNVRDWARGREGVRTREIVHCGCTDLLLHSRLLPSPLSFSSLMRVHVCESMLHQCTCDMKTSCVHA
jgi:hypothetical protein